MNYQRWMNVRLIAAVAVALLLGTAQTGLAETTEAVSNDVGGIEQPLDGDLTDLDNSSLTSGRSGRGYLSGAEGEGPYAKPEKPDMLVTEHAFPENSAALKFRQSDGVDDGQADETEFAFEGNLVLSKCTFISVEVPYLLLDPEADPNTSGFGDLEIGLRHILYAYKPPKNEQYGSSSYGSFASRSGERASGMAPRGYYRTNERGEKYFVPVDEDVNFYLTSGLNVTAPTGDVDRGLGEGHTNLEPVLLLFAQPAPFTSLQGEWSIEIPVGGGSADDIFHYNLGLSRALPGTKCWPLFHWVSPLFEVNGHTALGSQPGGTVVNLTTGAFWELTEHSFANIGYSFPVTGTRDFDNQLLFSFVHDFQ